MPRGSVRNAPPEHLFQCLLIAPTQQMDKTWEKRSFSTTESAPVHKTLQVIHLDGGSNRVTGSVVVIYSSISRTIHPMMLVRRRG